MLNSCVLFSSQPEYAGYKLSKGALEHLASSLRDRARPARHPGQHGRAVVHLRGRQQGLLRLAGVRGRRHPRRHLRREGRPDRPQAARVAGGGRPRGAVPRLRPGLRRHRPDADRRLRRVPRLMTRGAHERQHHGPRAPGRRVLRGHRRRRRAHHRDVRLRRHRARGGAAGPGRGPGLARGGADAARQLLPALGGEERAGRRAAHAGAVRRAPRARRRTDRAADLPDGPAPHRHHRAAPATCTPTPHARGWRCG